MPDGFEKLRIAAAVARETLKEAASRKSGIARRGRTMVVRIPISFRRQKGRKSGARSILGNRWYNFLLIAILIASLVVYVRNRWRSYQQHCRTHIATENELQALEEMAQDSAQDMTTASTLKK